MLVVGHLWGPRLAERSHGQRMLIRLLVGGRLLDRTSERGASVLDVAGADLRTADSHDEVERCLVAGAGDIGEEFDDLAVGAQRLEPIDGAPRGVRGRVIAEPVACGEPMVDLGR
ncbi:MAG: hypothetical protein AAF548_02770 [Actinomycetota bacterium]